MNNEGLIPKTLDDILTEKDVIELFGLKKSAIDEFRQNHRLPFCKMSRTNRLYLLSDVLEFIASKRIVLNRGSDSNEQGS